MIVAVVFEVVVDLNTGLYLLSVHWTTKVRIGSWPFLLDNTTSIPQLTCLLSNSPTLLVHLRSIILFGSLFTSVLCQKLTFFILTLILFELVDCEFRRIVALYFIFHLTIVATNIHITYTIFDELLLTHMAVIFLAINFRWIFRIVPLFKRRSLVCVALIFLEV